MDGRDIALLRALILDIHGYPARSEVRETQASIARKLHLSKQTVKHRIDGYRNSGFLKRWQIFLNPKLIGQELAQVHLDVIPPSSKGDVIAKIRLVDGVWHIANMYGNALGVGLSYENETALRNRLQLIARICNSEQVSLGRIPFPSCGYRFAPIDLAIIRAANGDPWQSNESIAKRAGVSTRTVKRRLDSMIRERAIFVTPNLDVTRLKGTIVADLMVFFAGMSPASEAEQEVARIINEKFVSAVKGPGYSYSEMLLGNIAEKSGILTRVKMLDGVKEAYLDLVEEHLPQHEIFDVQIEMLARGLEKAGLPHASIRAPPGVR
jgi:DNA-binding Lrp family transcriptional regulator